MKEILCRHIVRNISAKYCFPDEEARAIISRVMRLHHQLIGDVMRPSVGDADAFETTRRVLEKGCEITRTVALLSNRRGLDFSRSQGLSGLGIGRPHEALCYVQLIDTAVAQFGERRSFSGGVRLEDCVWEGALRAAAYRRRVPEDNELVGVPMDADALANRMLKKVIPRHIEPEFGPADLLMAMSRKRARHLLWHVRDAVTRPRTEISDRIRQRSVTDVSDDLRKLLDEIAARELQLLQAWKRRCMAPGANR